MKTLISVGPSGIFRIRDIVLSGVPNRLLTVCYENLIEKADSVKLIH